ncbi:hypothetical protein Scep_006778 [Stephania cephalantha]|uniref:Uncharacterized protein n=1 Tax=Stephania cephalantha TaxID=152367 RepID=A0AAP0K8U4_9MAGN
MNHSLSNSSLHRHRQLSLSSSTERAEIRASGLGTSMWVLGVLCSSSGSAWFPKVIHERDWYYPSFLGPHTERSRVKVKANLKPTRPELPPLPARGAHQAPSAASGRSFVASKAEEVKMVKEVLLLKSSSSPSSSSTTTMTTACGLGGSAVLYLVMGVYGYNIEHILMVDIIPDQSVRKAMNEINAVEILQFLEETESAKLQRRRQELTQTTSDQPVDDEAVYYKVAGECPKGRVYGLGSLGRKKRRYADPDASTSQLLAQRGMDNFMILKSKRTSGGVGKALWRNPNILKYGLVGFNSELATSVVPPQFTFREEAY